MRCVVILQPISLALMLYCLVLDLKTAFHDDFISIENFSSYEIFVILQHIFLVLLHIV